MDDNHIPISDDLLWKIVDLLDDGFIVYLHRETQQLLDHPDPKRRQGSEDAYLIDEVREQVDKAPEQYIVLEPPDSKEGFEIMAEFIETVQDENLKRRLADALHSKKPFRYFRTAVEETPLADDWYDYRDAWMKVWVTDKLEAFW